MKYKKVNFLSLHKINKKKYLVDFSFSELRENICELENKSQMVELFQNADLHIL